MARLRHWRDHQRRRRMAMSTRRLRICLAIRDRVPVLQHRPYDRRIWSQDAVACSKGRLPQLDFLRDWTLWMDGCVPGWYLGLQTHDDHLDVLVDDAGRNDVRLLHRRTDQLVVDHSGNQGALCLMSRYLAPDSQSVYELKSSFNVFCHAQYVTNDTPHRIQSRYNTAHTTIRRKIKPVIELCRSRCHAAMLMFNSLCIPFYKIHLSCNTNSKQRHVPSSPPALPSHHSPPN